MCVCVIICLYILILWHWSIQDEEGPSFNRILFQRRLVSWWGHLRIWSGWAMRGGDLHSRNMAMATRTDIQMDTPIVFLCYRVKYHSMLKLQCGKPNCKPPPILPKICWYKVVGTIPKGSCIDARLMPSVWTFTDWRRTTTQDDLTSMQPETRRTGMNGFL